MTVELKKQVRWAYKGLKASNKTAPLLKLYLERKSFAELGYRFDPDDTPTWEANAYSIIDNEISKLKQKDMEKQKSGSRR